MKTIRIIISILIVVIPAGINTAMWEITNQKDSIFIWYMAISTYYLGFQFLYYAILFTRWFNSKLK